MAFEHPGDGALDYLPCRYGESRLVFRGPKKGLEKPFAAFIGATETYGRFIEFPFPDLVEDRLGKTTVNLGCMNAGIDVFAQDSGLLDIVNKAKVTVIQIMGAQNLTNRFFSVHPRRNDRFIAPSALMKTVFREVDFTDFSFTRHMMQSLHQYSPQRFEIVVAELRTAWVARMRILLGRITGPKVLLWLADHEPGQTQPADSGYEHDPLYIDRAMLDAVVGRSDGLVEVVYSPRVRTMDPDGKVFSELEAPAAMETPGITVHEEATDALVPVLEKAFS